MDPAYIKDPRLRTEYQAAIETNRKRLEEFSRQRALRSIKQPFNKQVESILLAALRTDPGLEEKVLAELTLIQDNEARERVLARIRSRER